MGFIDMSQSENPGVLLVAIPNIFDFRQDRRIVRPGLTVAEMVEIVSPHKDWSPYASVQIGADEIPESMWHCVRAREGSAVSIRFVPGGGGGKNPIATVLTIALMVALPGIGVALSGAMGLAGSGLWLGTTFISAGQFLAVGAGVVGSMAINALAPPPKPRGGASQAGADNPTLFITGAQNQGTPWGPVPMPLGKTRMVPPLGAQWYTEIVGEDQYLRGLFIWGYGPLAISAMKIGETDLADFDGVTTETRYGYDADTPLTLYSNSVHQNDLSIALTFAAGYITRTTEPNCDEISVDLTFPAGIGHINISGKKAARTVQVSVGYSIKDAGIWTDTTYTYTDSRTSAIRENVRIVLANNQYDVRVKRLTADSDTTTVEEATTHDTVSWTALRTISYTQPVTMQGLAMTAIRIKATDQLNGVISQFNGVVQSVLPDWNGSAWVEQATSNPASIYRAVLQSAANARPLADARIDLAALAAWHANCSTAGREYNNVISGGASVRDVLSEVASCGRAAPGLIDGLWTVVEDKPQTTPIQHFTPRNSWGFSGQKAYPDQPHAFRVQFLNRDNGWNADERIVYDDGYTAATATKFETLTMTGVTSSDQAWKDGRYHIATARLRPEVYSFYTDIEHLRCTRGDLIKFTHDVPLFGMMTGRVKALTTGGGNITALTLDADITMAGDGTLYGIRFRKSDGTSLRLDLVTSATTTPIVTLVTPYDEATGPAVGDLFMFGVRNSETVDMVVKSIEPGQDLSAKITCVDAAPAVHTSDTGTIPSFVSQITPPPEFTRPPAPVVATVQAGDEVLIVNADGSFHPSIVITLSPPGYPFPVTPGVVIQTVGSTAYRPARFTSNNNQITITDVESGGIYSISIVYKNQIGISSAATVIAGEVVDGGTVVPDDIAGFSMNALGGNAFLSWDAPTNLNVAAYRLKFNSATTGASWANSIDIIPRLSKPATSVSVPTQSGTYLIKAIGINGLESAAETLLVSTIDNLFGFNAVATVTENPTFPGAKTDVAVNGGNLELVAALTGTYTFNGAVDLGGVYTSRLSANVGAVGSDTNADVDDWLNVDNVENWDGSVDPAAWNVQLQVRTTQDDPSGTPTWAAWQNFIIGDYAAWGLQFRALLSATVSGITPSISTLEVTVDMPDQVQGENNLSGLSTDASGTQVTFPNQFKAVPAIAVAAQNMATGDYFTILSPAATGFLIKFFNSAGTRITRTFDYVSKGYGSKQ